MKKKTTDKISEDNLKFLYTKSVLREAIDDAIRGRYSKKELYKKYGLDNEKET